MTYRLSAVASLLRGLRRAKLLVGDYRPLLPVYLRLTAEGAGRAVTDATDLVVEGFQRSGTTFSANAIRLAQTSPILVTNHVHNTSILRVAIQRGVPTMVVVRSPRACISSYVVWDPRIGARTVLWEWLHYHRQLVDLAPRLVVATFEQATTDLGSVVDRVNDRFDTDFDRPPGGSEFRDRVDSYIREEHRIAHPTKTASLVVPVPDAGRAGQLREWSDRIDRDPKLQEGLRQADVLHRRLESLANST